MIIDQRSPTFTINPYRDSTISSQFNPKQSIQHSCSFCTFRPHILNQLNTLKQAVLAKNNKIKELEELIQKISKMAFTSSTDLDDNFTSVPQPTHRELPEELTFAHHKLSPNKHSQSPLPSFNQSKTSLHSYESSASQLGSKTQIGSIRQEIRKLNITKSKEKEGIIKQSALRNKLLSIMSMLPNGSTSQLQSFASGSQPMGQGTIGSMQSRTFNSRPKPMGFIKKSQKIDSMFGSQRVEQSQK